MRVVSMTCSPAVTLIFPPGSWAVCSAVTSYVPACGTSRFHVMVAVGVGKTVQSLSQPCPKNFAPPSSVAKGASNSAPSPRVMGKRCTLPCVEAMASAKGLTLPQPLPTWKDTPTTLRERDHAASRRRGMSTARAPN